MYLLQDALGDCNVTIDLSTGAEIALFTLHVLIKASCRTTLNRAQRSEPKTPSSQTQG